MNYISKIKFDGTTYLLKDSYPAVSSVAGNTGAITTAQIATALTNAGYKLTDTVVSDTNTWRPIAVNGTTQLSDSSTTLNLKAGSNVSLSYSSGAVTISSSYSNTTYSAGTGLSLSGTTFSLGTSGVTAGSYGPSSNVSGSNGTTISVPYITVDSYGRITSISNKTYTSVNTDTNTTYSAGTGLSLSGTTFSVSYGTAAGTACLGNDSRLSDSRTASDVYSWAKASTKPSYTLAEVGASMSVVAITAATSSSCSITGSGNAGKSETIIYTNSSGADLTVTVPTTYTTPDGAAIELTCPDGGYCEVNYLNVGGTVYARGL